MENRGGWGRKRKKGREGENMSNDWRIGKEGGREYCMSSDVKVCKSIKETRI